MPWDIFRPPVPDVEPRPRVDSEEEEKKIKSKPMGKKPEREEKE